VAPLVASDRSEAAEPARAFSPGLGAFLKRLRLQVDRHARTLGPYRRVPHRVGRAVTQEEVAEALEVTRTWYALIEAENARASPALLDRIAIIFALDAHDRLVLFQLGIPGLATSRPEPPDDARTLDALSSQSLTRLGLTIGSLSEIERTAKRLASLRATFLSSGDAQSLPVRARIVDSWTRCVAAGVDAAQRTAPLTVTRDAELAELREENERLLRAARGVVAYLATELADSGYAVVLVDRKGCILELTGDVDVRRSLERRTFLPGGLWSEAAAGTNAIGTALADGRPFQLLAGEHFCDGWQDFSCSAAPIRDPRSFDIVGLIDITGSYKLIRSHLLPLIMQCALLIEEELTLLNGRN
jgi:transcriptional regulator with XRE-family HTH domain